MAECDERSWLAALSLVNSGIEADDGSNETSVAINMSDKWYLGHLHLAGLGQAPPGNGFGIGLTTKDDQALDSGVGKPGVGSEWKLHGDVSWNASWTSYFLWTLKPAWSTRVFRAPAFRFFGGSQKVQTLPYFGEGEDTSPNAAVNYALQRTAFGGMADATLKQKPLGFTTVLHLQAAGNWYSLSLITIWLIRGTPSGGV
jgi:hypothetical protein